MADGSRNTEQPMEATTPFDLNQAIQRWRENLGQSPAFRRENLFELESHLRDSVATLQRQGLSDEEALMVATKRLGSAAELAAKARYGNHPNLLAVLFAEQRHGAVRRKV